MGEDLSQDPRLEARCATGDDPPCSYQRRPTTRPAHAGIGPRPHPLTRGRRRLRVPLSPWTISNGDSCRGSNVDAALAEAPTGPPTVTASCQPSTVRTRLRPGTGGRCHCRSSTECILPAHGEAERAAANCRELERHVSLRKRAGQPDGLHRGRGVEGRRPPAQPQRKEVAASLDGLGDDDFHRRRRFGPAPLSGIRPAFDQPTA